MRGDGRKFGFALPTVLIASVIMLTVLATVVQVVGTSQNALNDQFYVKLAQAAGESGIAMANACESDASGSGGIGWTDSSPLGPNTDCTGTAVQSCPQGTTSQNCFVVPPQTMTNAKISTTFSVGAPTETAAGDALQITAVGETDLLRTSDGLPWRVYKQTVSQRLANTCAATSSVTQGWHQAVVSTVYPSSLPSGWTGPTTNVQTIQASTSNSTNDFTGPTWFQKNFNVLSSGSYTLSALADDRIIVYIDGQQMINNNSGTDVAGWNVTSTDTISNLSAGCHTMVVEAINLGAMPNPTDTTVALAKTGSSTPLIASDTTWRAYTPSFVYAGAPNYFMDGSSWVETANYNTNASGASWTNVPAQAPYAEWVGVPADGGVGKAPANSYAYFLDNHTFVTTAASTGIHINTNCDDLCYVYVDGQQVDTGWDNWSGVLTSTTSVGPGIHQLGLVLANNGAGQAGFLLSATRDDTGAVISYSDRNWATTNYWYGGISGIAQGYSGFPKSYAINWAPSGQQTQVSNLVTNPSMETKNGSGAPTCTSTGWGAVNSTISAVNTWASPTSWDPASGGDPNTATQGCSLKIVPNGSSIDSYVNMPGSTTLSTNTTYSVSATVHLPAALTGTLNTADNRQIGISVIWNGYIMGMVTAPNVAGTYHLTLNFQVPTGATGISIRLYDGSSSTSDVVYWDNVMLTQGHLPYAFADGDSTSGACSGSWTWGGTAGNSTSTGTIPAGCQAYQG